MVDDHADVLTAGTNIVLAKGTGVTGFNDLSAAQVNTEADTALADYDAPTSAELVSEINSVQADIAALTIPTAAAVADAVWDEAIAGSCWGWVDGRGVRRRRVSAGDPWATAIPGAYGAGTAGKILGDNVNATISSRATQTSVDDVPTNAELATALGTADDAVLAAIAALNNLSQANIRTALGMGSANLDTQLGDVPTNAELATALAAADDAVLAAITALNNLSSAQAQTAAAAALTAYDPPTHTELTTALAGADDAVLAAVSALPTAIQISDALLARDLGSGTLAGVEDERTVRSALRFNRNKFTIAGGVLTVFCEDDSTVAFTAAITQTAGNPVSASDPT